VRDPYDIVRDFEKALSEYTGADYCVALNSCTAALKLCYGWYVLHGGRSVEIPSKTYPSVWMQAAIIGLQVKPSGPWEGVYNLRPSNIWDCAKRLTVGMYRCAQFQCLSFHPQKPLGLANGGGAILHDNAEADRWFRKMRFDGRTEGVPTRDDEYQQLGEHCYMFPATAAEGLQKLSIYAREIHHADQPAELELYPNMSRWYSTWRK